MDAKDRRIAQLEAALRAARLTHHYESDAPCPLTLRPGERGDLGDACTCGVGEHNAAIDQALAGKAPTPTADLRGVTVPLTHAEAQHPFAYLTAVCRKFAYDAECLGDEEGRRMALSIEEWIKAEIRKATLP